MKREIKALTSRRPNSTCAGFCLSFQARWPLLPTNSIPLSLSACRVLHTPPLRVGILNLPQGVALVTTRSGQTPPAPKFVLGFPGLHHHGNSFGVGVFFRFGTSGLHELVEADAFSATGSRSAAPAGLAIPSP